MKREHKPGGGIEGEADSPRSREPNPRTLRSLPEPRQTLNRLSQSGVPCMLLLTYNVYVCTHTHTHAWRRVSAVRQPQATGKSRSSCPPGSLTAARCAHPPALTRPPGHTDTRTHVPQVTPVLSRPQQPPPPPAKIPLAQKPPAFLLLEPLLPVPVNLLGISWVPLCLRHTGPAPCSWTSAAFVPVSPAGCLPCAHRGLLSGL